MQIVVATCNWLRGAAWICSLAYCQATESPVHRVVRVCGVSQLHEKRKNRGKQNCNISALSLSLDLFPNDHCKERKQIAFPQKEEKESKSETSGRNNRLRFPPFCFLSLACWLLERSVKRVSEFPPLSLTKL